jgi:hypothetical protein
MTMKTQIDRSGQGHHWEDVDVTDLPSAVREEIAGEIVDGKRESGQIVGSNGMHYRWMDATADDGWRCIEETR